MKKDLSKIHPELRGAARMAPRLTYGRHNLWLINSLSRLRPPVKTPPELLIENVFIPRQREAGKIRLRLYRPRSASAPGPALLWLHGGGYVLGSPEQDDACCIQYAHELGITVVSVDYRYAPRHPFPAGLEDAYAALQWAASQPDGLGLDIRRIAIGGASAGGGLAAALVQMAHDRGEFKPIFQLLVYPMLDDRSVLRADMDDSQNVTWNQKSNRFGWESYLGRACGAQDLPAYAVPARRENLAGLPRAWIGVGTLDLFHDEDLAYARRLQEAGVPCELCVVEGAFHGFDVFDQGLPVVQGFRKSQLSAMKHCFFE